MITNDQRAALIQAACQVRLHAHAPYSTYAVGAALLTEDGRIYTGVNVENASYGLTICAERAAIFAAVSEGERSFVAIAVCTENMGSPCGACRQVLSEFAPDLTIILADTHDNMRETSLRTLLPDSFDPEHLNVSP